MQSLSDTGWFVESCDAITFVMAFSSTLATLGLLQAWALRVSKSHVDRSHGLKLYYQSCIQKATCMHMHQAEAGYYC